MRDLIDNRWIPINPLLSLIWTSNPVVTWGRIIFREVVETGSKNNEQTYRAASIIKN